MGRVRLLAINGKCVSVSVCMIHAGDESERSMSVCERGYNTILNNIMKYNVSNLR
jgi:hypothetical protein